MKDVIITGFSHATAQGVTLIFNKAARIIGTQMEAMERWVSWDKIGAALVEKYSDEFSVAERDNLRSES